MPKLHFLFCYVTALGLRQLECGMAGGASLRVGRSGAVEEEVEKGRKQGKYARNVHVYPELHSASGGPPQLGKYKGGPCCCLQLRMTLTSLREKWRGLSRPSSSLQKLQFTFCWKGEALSKRDRLDRKQDRDSYLREDYSSRETKTLEAPEEKTLLYTVLQQN